MSQTRVSHSDDFYRFTFGANGEVLRIEEFDDGRWQIERPDRDESYSRIDGYVVKSERDDGRLEWEAYADPDGDGIWVEIAEGRGVFTSSLLTPTTPATPAAPGLSAATHRFTITDGAVTRVEERDDGRWAVETIEANERYDVTAQGVLKTEVGRQIIERTLFTDADGDGLYAESLSWDQPVGGVILADYHHFTFTAAGGVGGIYEEEDGVWSQLAVKAGESYSLVDGLVIKQDADGWSVFADSNGDQRWVEAVEGAGPLDLVAVKGLIDTMVAEGSLF